MSTLPPVPIFPRSGNRLVAVNPSLVRSVETDDDGRVRIVFDRDHEIIVRGSLIDVIKALWTPSTLREIEIAAETQ